VRIRTLPHWCRPGWDDDDIYKLSVPELGALKLRVAVAVGARYKGNSSPQLTSFGHETGGTKALDPKVCWLFLGAGRVETGGGKPFTRKLRCLRFVL
jgi:hypothetical protein